MLHGQGHKIHKLHLGYCPHAGHPGPDGCAGDTVFGNGGIADPLRPIFFKQAGGDAKRAAVQANILAQHKDLFIASQRQVHRLPQGLGIGDFTGPRFGVNGGIGAKGVFDPGR